VSWFSCLACVMHVLSFPTRRSSDLSRRGQGPPTSVLDVLPPEDYRAMIEHRLGGIVSQAVVDIVDFHSGRNPGKLLELLEYTSRSEEHTSELQSRFDLVCRLLLE